SQVASGPLGGIGHLERPELIEQTGRPPQVIDGGEPVQPQIDPLHLGARDAHDRVADRSVPEISIALAELPGLSQRSGVDLPSTVAAAAPPPARPAAAIAGAASETRMAPGKPARAESNQRGMRSRLPNQSPAARVA